MILFGLLITVLGFVLSLLALGFTSSMSVRMSLVLAGIALSLFGIVGLINRTYMKNAIWRK